MRQQTILPCRFCTIYRSTASLHQVLEQSYQRCLYALSYLYDKEEWGVKAYADDSILRGHVLATNNTLLQMNKARQGALPGLSYLLQKNLGQRLAERLEQTLARFSAQLTQELTPYSTHAQPVRSTLGSLSLSQARLFINTAYLISKPQLVAFLGTCQALQERLAHEGIRLALSGPWPPYHFSPQMGS
jgi:Gas vesicle synthesis protein GvpL/GvpF